MFSKLPNINWNYLGFFKFFLITFVAETWKQSQFALSTCSNEALIWKLSLQALMLRKNFIFIIYWRFSTFPVIMFIGGQISMLSMISMFENMFFNGNMPVTTKKNQSLMYLFTAYHVKKWSLRSFVILSRSPTPCYLIAIDQFICHCSIYDWFCRKMAPILVGFAIHCAHHLFHFQYCTHPTCASTEPPVKLRDT